MNVAAMYERLAAARAGRTVNQVGDLIHWRGVRFRLRPIMPGYRYALVHARLAWADELPTLPLATACAYRRELGRATLAVLNATLAPAGWFDRFRVEAGALECAVDEELEQILACVERATRQAEAVAPMESR
jgi:hypothetical protein